MADLSVNFAGSRLNNPLVASAGPITSNLEMVKRLVDAGVGTFITKTGFTKREYERWVGRKNIFPYKPVYKYMSLTDGTLLSLPTLLDVPVSGMAKRIEKMKRLDVPVIASIMGLSPGGYRESAKIVESAGADAIEIDLCCTIPEFISLYKYGGQNATLNPKAYARIIKAVKGAVSIPVGIKSTASLYVAPRILEGLVRAKLSNRMPDFITLVGQLDQNPGVDMETLKPKIPHFPTLGWEGELKKLTYSQVALFRSTLGGEGGLDLSASGGIRDFEGVVNCLALGATTVQFQTAILDKGPDVITRIIKGLDGYLDRRGISSVEEIIGTASGDYIPALSLGRFMRERDRLYGTLYAAVDKALCSGCGLCERICTEDAVSVVDRVAVIDRNLCRGCNLCVLKCPREAISLLNSEKLEELVCEYRDSEGSRTFKDFMNKKRINLFDLVTICGRLRSWGLM